MTDELFMKRCIELAQRGRGAVSPNPMVGAVLVHNDVIIAEGWHREYGGDHAEVDCLKNVNDADRHLIPECTMYVNLEPCAHHGKTPPCADRLVKEKIKKVVIANKDPFEQVDGKGIKILAQAGIDVVTGVLEKEAYWLNRRFFTFHQKKRPYIILKWAQTVDGFIAPPDKGRMQITDKHAMQLVHKWRTEEAAIMVGTTTAINDNPQLTARMWEGRQPLRIIIDRSLKVPASHHVYDGAAETWVVNEKKEEKANQVQYVRLPFDGQFINRLFARLYAEKVMSVIVEGGAQLLNSMIEAGVWEEARVFTGSITMGDGLTAPVLYNAQHTMSMQLGADRLDVFIHNIPANKGLQGLSLL